MLANRKIDFISLSSHVVMRKKVQVRHKRFTLGNIELIMITQILAKVAITFLLLCHLNKISSISSGPIKDL